MKYYLIAGEASGDLHGSGLVKGLLLADPAANIRAWGGDLMEEAGAKVVKHYRDLAFMGFLEVASNLRTIKKNFASCKADILDFQPDVLILLDYPGFNLRMAKWAKENGIRVFYYISPQIWAWHTSRVHGIKETVDEMFVILPFEQAFYQRYDMSVHYEGHPLMDRIRNYPVAAHLRAVHGLDDRPIIALLPGSRKQEVGRLLPTMLEMAPQFTDYQFVIAAASALPDSFYESVAPAFGKSPNVRLIRHATYDILTQAEAALVASGTATLETALFGVPQVVCYKGSPLSYAIARRVVQVPYISLVNLILDKLCVEELIQQDFTTQQVKRALSEIVEGGAKRSNILQGYSRLQESLGDPGVGERVGRQMVAFLSEPRVS